MLHFYVLYACLYMIPGKHAVHPPKARCVEAQAYFQADDCRRQLPKGGGLMEHNRHSRSWLECKETRADSWIAADANDPGSRLYKAQASASDGKGLTALLAPLSPQARARLKPGELGRRFQMAFQGPGNLSFFVVGTGKKVIACAVTDLDDFQFADMAADVSSAAESMTNEKDLDFDTIVEDAGVKASYHSELSERTMPPPGGMDAGP